METYSKVLHAHKLKVTPLREAVLATLMFSDKGLSRQDLNKSLSLTYDRSSLFRTLNTFEEKGILHKVIDTDGVAKYAYSLQHGNRENSQHAHFICLRCNNTFCLDNSVTLIQIQLPQGFIMESMAVQLHGLCDQCRKKVEVNNKETKSYV